MAVSPKAVASWGLLADAGGGIIQVTQVIQEMEVRLAAADTPGRGTGSRGHQRGVEG